MSFALYLSALTGSPTSTPVAGPTPYMVVQLAPAIAEQKPSTAASAAFYSTTLSVEMGAGVVQLASDPDGSGNLRTDDQATLAVQRSDGSIGYWTHDFRNPVTGVIEAINTQDISKLFGRGMHTVTLTLIDLAPPVHSTLPYYLVYIPEGNPSTPASATPMVRVVTPVPSLRATQAATHIGAANPRATTISPSVTHTSPPAATARSKATEVQPGTPDPQQMSTSILPWALALFAIATLAGAIFLIKRQHARVSESALYGIVSLYDAATKERCERLDLTLFAGIVGIYTNPLRLAPVRKEEVPLATLLKDEDGMVCRVTTMGELKTTPLRDRDEMKLGANGRVTLNFRAPASSGTVARIAT